MGDDESASSDSSSATNVTLSDKAKAHMAHMAKKVADAADTNATAASSDASANSDATADTGTDAASSSSTADASSAADAPASSDDADTPTDPLDTIRAWFDDQYDKLGISSAMLDGKVAVDLSGQSRDILSQVAANTDGRFSKDESAAAAAELTSRFNNAMASHVVDCPSHR